MLSANAIRSKFLNYFQDKGHTEVSSSNLVPQDDPSLLFTNSGMVQFKKIFLGQEKRDYNRAVTAQKCLRVGGKHNDLENVGRTARHHTFFEMLGNFSFGDYFKEQAIEYAWTFITKELGLAKDKLYITIYTDDDEASELWQKVTGIAPERIFRLGEKDNFWSMGDTGPCGPCSEIHFDQGEDMACGPNCGIGQCDCDRYLEIWNLVFMQYEQAADGTKTTLPRPSIDTGMGLERIAAICQGVQSNFDTDLFQAIIGFTANLTGVQYKKQSEDTDTALRVIADHSRAIAFMIAEGILPSNEGRGYVLRRLIRRALRFGKLLGQNDPFLYKVTEKVVQEMGGHYPELHSNKDFMLQVVKEEEKRFAKTLDKGLAMLEEELEALCREGQKTLSGKVAFKLYDTYGFPIDIISDVAEKQGVSIDEPGFTALMQDQKDKSKAGWKGSGDTDLATTFQTLLQKGLTTTFTGYETLVTASKITALLNDKALSVNTLEGKGYVVTAKTPCYGESGGQEGDIGEISTPSGSAEILKTVRPAPHLLVHLVDVNTGQLDLGQEAVIQVTEDTRLATARNHTATHLLHAALKNILGDHVQQSGSLVNARRLRFDFTHIAAMTADELKKVEDAVNTFILANKKLLVTEMSYDTALEKGAIALFGEKYTDTVRVVEVPGISTELCGGTHLKTTAQAGPFVIVAETGIAAGIRRIEALTGFEALAYLQEMALTVKHVSELLKGTPSEVTVRVKTLQQEVKKLRKERSKAAVSTAQEDVNSILQHTQNINNILFLARKVDLPGMGPLRNMLDDLRSKMQSGVIALACAFEGKANLVVFVSKDLHNRITAPQLIKEGAALCGGSGGGRPDMAQAGGNNPAGIDAALAKIKQIAGES